MEVTLLMPFSKKIPLHNYWRGPFIKQWILLASLLIAFTHGFASGASPAKKKPASRPAKGDSVETLRFILQREFKQKEQIFRLKKKNFADSLVEGKLSLSEKQLQNLMRDSTLSEEIKTQMRFRNYWAKVEAENGITALKSQYDARDPDRSRIPKVYLADSSILILPGWIVWRKH